MPTSRAKAYALEVKDALDRIGRASVDLTANPDGGVLNLAILPTFGTRWLAPRLGRFLSSHLGITVNMATRLRPFDFGLERFDAAIHFGRPDWPGGECVHLMKEWVVPCCSKNLRDGLDPMTPAALLDAPLLYLESRPEAWLHWFKRHDVPVSEVRSMQFDQFATMARAASVGLGIALLPIFLVETELAEGSLVSAFGEPCSSDGEYYLVWPAGSGEYPPLKRFRDWIGAEIIQSDPVHIGDSKARQHTTS